MSAPTEQMKKVSVPTLTRGALEIL